MNRGIFSALRGGSEGPFDVLWVHGYATIDAMHGMMAAKALGSRCSFEPIPGFATANALA
jgi:hypothetical protein